MTNKKQCPSFNGLYFKISKENKHTATGNTTELQLREQNCCSSSLGDLSRPWNKWLPFLTATPPAPRNSRAPRERPYRHPGERSAPVPAL